MIEVRPAEEHDVDDLIAAETHGPARIHLRTRWQQQADGTAVFLLAHLDGAIAGHALLLRESKYAEMRTTYGVPEVNALHAYVEGKGVGTALIAAAEAIASQWGYGGIGLAVEPNNARARRLYGRLGYAERAEVMDEWTEQADDGTVLRSHADPCLYLTKPLPAERRP